MSTEKNRQVLVSSVAAYLALVLQYLPLPPLLATCWPPWPALISLYWTQVLPTRSAGLASWSLGLLTDKLAGNLLGTHALAFSLAVPLLACLQPILRRRSLDKQIAIVFGLLGFMQLTVLAIHMLTHPLGSQSWLVLATALALPALVGSLLWPSLAYCLDRAYARLKPSHILQTAR